MIVDTRIHIGTAPPLLASIPSYVGVDVNTGRVLSNAMELTWVVDRMLKLAWHKAQLHILRANTKSAESQLNNLLVTIPEISEAIECTGEDRPSKPALSIASTLLPSIDRDLLYRAPKPTVEGFEGDLIVHWTFQDRGLSLVFLSDGSLPKLYTETVKSGGTTAETGLTHANGSKEITSALRWMLRLD